MRTMEGPFPEDQALQYRSPAATGDAVMASQTEGFSDGHPMCVQSFFFFLPPWSKRCRAGLLLGLSWSLMLLLPRALSYQIVVSRRPAASSVLLIPMLSSRSASEPHHSSADRHMMAAPAI